MKHGFLRALTLTLAALLLLSLSVPLASCSSKNPADADETSSANDAASPQPQADASGVPGAGAEEEDGTAEPPLDDGLGNPDLGGYDFRILSCYFNDLDTWRYLLFDEITGTPLNDQLYQTKDNLENRFNIKFSMIEPGDDGAAQGAFIQSVTGGDDAFDMHIGKDWRTCELGIKGYCYNLFDIDPFDFEKPWWPDETVRQLSVGKKMFAASNYASYCGIHWTRVMVMNKDLLANLQIDLPYETVREGRWTLDELYRVTNGISVDENGNGQCDRDDTLALVGYDHTYYCIQEAAAVSAYARDENNVPFLNLDVERIDGFVGKMRALLTGNDYLKADTALFADGKTVFSFCEIRDAYNIYRNSDVRYGFLPQPKYDELQEKYIACCTDTPWALPKTLAPAQEEIVGTVLEAMSCYNYVNMLPVYLESTLKSRLADEPDDAEMLSIIADNRTISFAYSFGKLTYNNLIADCVFASFETASYLKRSERMASKTLEKTLAKFLD